MADKSYVSEPIDLPSKGKFYPTDSPLRNGKVDVKYMTAKEEDILTSENLIKKGVVIDRLLDSLIVTPGVVINDMLVGDKNAIMIAARILAYGPEYTVDVQNPTTGEIHQHTFNLGKCPFKKIPKNITENLFETTLPVSKTSVKYKLLTGYEEAKIIKDIQALKKTGSAISRELTTRLKYSIVEVDGDADKGTISNFVDSMLSRDSLFLRQEINKISPDIDLTQEIEMEGQAVDVDIPITADFFWPKLST